MFRLFRKHANREVIERLHGEIVAAARHPALYRACGVADTFEGRFEMLVLHAVLVLRRLRQFEAPGPDIAQDLVNAVFAHFDATLREMGLGDLAVPKRMKMLAEGFFGRAAAYAAALDAGDESELAAALARNVFGGRADRPDIDPLERYVRAAAVALAALPVGAFVAGEIRFADPASYERALP
ncbi:MAG: ubiquinol-cytochrome c chaperone [Methylobacteriaceae bacterium]|nr:ubiquinol-cytochrome c chaperone [Methylobacteriaceae bacterium]MBV9245355.1 ubiquinol-cytochrome c chaperone [Methylobacteriaceae bacterium]MBV9636410.1 ubiquinol-cytochrome c chaperone [Methylobacteriaceae bacterium]